MGEGGVHRHDEVDVTCLELLVMGENENELTELEGADAMKVNTKPAAVVRGAMVIEVLAVAIERESGASGNTATDDGSD